ncbi:hypothetical protein M427DRAFT_45190 [Gonapodya prolifera JEL478]|uniref:Potassium channel tetramerisation-type BTB domain-containing protein n=1 Tax=Gonapodya prolifera (strain JEL478) TaxID=1344416 RepID=A0A139ABI9_GONPJ|nr:hypothetical protein M427DRAFT_45190 [Gonapodya prolifera JEL478]|eukprot:KXS14088.1 hypothetical protein M427DRAFT_45190 [Gonapodya prolifera JEL478]
MSDPDPITALNVGGTLLNKCQSTLLLVSEQDSFLSKMFGSERFLPARTDDNGHNFLDRDPNSFGVILNYLRSNVLDPVKVERIGKERLIGEAQFFGLAGMESILLNVSSKEESSPSQDENVFADAAGLLRFQYSMVADRLHSVPVDEMDLPSSFVKASELRAVDVQAVFDAHLMLWRVRQSRWRKVSSITCRTPNASSVVLLRCTTRRCR